MAQDNTSILFTPSTPNLSLGDIHVMKKYDIQIVEDTIHDHDYVMPINIPLTDLIHNVVAYIAGYVIKMTERIIKCPICIETLRNHGDSAIPNLALLFRKKWEIYLYLLKMSLKYAKKSK